MIMYKYFFRFINTLKSNTCLIKNAHAIYCCKSATKSSLVTKKKKKKNQREDFSLSVLVSLSVVL